MDTVQPENKPSQDTTEPIESPPDAISATSEPIKPASIGTPKKLIQGLVVVFILLILTAGGYYIVSNNLLTTNNSQLTTISPTVEPTIDPTADWGLYANTKIGFSIKYPSRYGKPQLPSSREVTYATGSEDDITIGFGEKSEDSFYLQIIPFIGTVDQLMNSDNPLVKDANSVKTLVKEVTVADTKGKWYIATPPTVYPGVNAGAQKVYFVGKNHGFVLDTPRNYSSQEIEKILSTFKFTELGQAVDTSNWKTYTDSKMTFKYPQNWNIVKNTDGGVSLNSGDSNKEIFYINIRTDKDTFDLKKEFEAEQYGNIENKRDVQLGVAKGTEYFGCFGVEGCIRSYEIIADSAKNRYQITFRVDIEPNTSVYREIISTLKFTQ